MSRVKPTRKNVKAVADSAKPINPGKHAAECKIYVHAQPVEIELEFVNCASANRIATTFAISRDSVYRHSHALDLFRRRQRNIRAALEKTIEEGRRG
jgi:hypothetical protein